MRKDRTPYRVRRTLCGVPADNHEALNSYGLWICLVESCGFEGSRKDATAHVVRNQFVAERSQ
jgi:hypothetical protein